METKQTQICHECGGLMVRDTKPISIKYKNLTAKFDMPGVYCTNCSESLHSIMDMRISDRALNRLKAQSEDLLLPTSIRQIRKRLSLTQESAGNIIGGGPNAFNKYENGSLLPSKSASNLLRVLSHYPDALKILVNAKTQAPEANEQNMVNATQRSTRPRKQRNTTRSVGSGSKDKTMV